METCVSIKTSEISKFVFILCIVGQLIISLALLLTMIGMIRYSHLSCCKRFSFGISMLTSIFCMNTLIIFSMMLAIVIFLGEGRNMLYDGSLYPFSVTLDSSGTISCVGSIFLAVMIDIWLGFVINFESQAKIKTCDLYSKRQSSAPKEIQLLNHAS